MRKLKVLISGPGNERVIPYIEIMERLGCDVVEGHLPTSDGSCDMLLLTGGRDVDPQFYHQKINGAVSVDTRRDECELKLIDAFVKAKKPIFGICRGMQLLNVYFGGTLIQDLPAMPMHHHDAETLFHEIETVKGSDIDRLLGPVFTANTYHHQAVDRLADDLIVTAYSLPDRVAEALQHKSLPVFAVQFHPERMTSGERSHVGVSLFRHFVAMGEARLQ